VENPPPASILANNLPFSTVRRSGSSILAIHALNSWPTGLRHFADTEAEADRKILLGQAGKEYTSI